MKSVSMIDPEARFLDYERVVRELNGAEQRRELDPVGVLEKLKEAYDTCQSAADRYSVKVKEAQRAGDAYIIARGKYLAEIKRRVEIPRGQRYDGLKAPQRIGWSQWCKDNHVPLSGSYDFMAAARGDMSKINARRRDCRERNRRKYCPDPLPNLKRLWAYLTPEQRFQFIQWALSGQDKTAEKGPDIRPDISRQTLSSDARSVAERQASSMI